jgi:hypothetical protein
VGDVGASGEAEGVDRRVSEAGQGPGRGTGPELGRVLMECHIAGPVETVVHGPVLAFVVVEVFGTREAGGQAGDPVRDFLGGPDIIEAADVAADAEDLAGSGPRRPRCRPPGRWSRRPGRCGQP